MHRGRRRLLIATGIVAATSALLAAPAFAGVTPVAACSGSTCITVANLNSDTDAATDATVHVAYSVHIDGGTATTATLDTHQDAALPADASTVTINGDPAAAGTITQTPGGNLSIDLSGTPLPGGDDIAVAFDATLSATSQAATWTSSATVTFASSGNAPATATSDDVVMRPTPNDLSLTAESTTVHVPRGAAADDLVLDAAHESGPSSDAILTLQFPSGFGLSGDGVADIVTQQHLTCTRAGQTWTCPISAAELATHPELEVGIAAADSLTPGASATLVASIAPVGRADSNPANNTADATLRVIGRAHLQFTMTPTPLQLAVGQTRTITVTVTNTGPDPAPHTTARLYSPLPVSDGSHVQIGDSATKKWTATQHTEDWNPGTLQPGQTARRTLVVTGLSTGTAAVSVLGRSDAYDPDPQCSGACDNDAFVTITVVAAGSQGAGTSSAGGPTLAATGPDTGQLLLVGLIVLAAGAALTVAGRRGRN